MEDGFDKLLRMYKELQAKQRIQIKRAIRKAGYIVPESIMYDTKMLEIFAEEICEPLVLLGLYDLS